MTRYVLWSLFVLVGLWTVRNVRIGGKVAKTPREVMKDSALANPTPAYRLRFPGDAERHRLKSSVEERRRVIAIRRIS